MKTIIEVKIADLNINRIRVVDDPSHPLTATLLVTGRDGKTEVAFACKRTYAGAQALEFATHSYADAAALIDLLTFNLTAFDVERLEGKLVRVSVLELLDKGWTLVRRPNDLLRCTSPEFGDSDTSDMMAISLAFVNDGVNLWAEYDGTTRSDADAFIEVLDRTGTKHEVIG
jgi:hypothetical protein